MQANKRRVGEQRVVCAVRRPRLIRHPQSPKLHRSREERAGFVFAVALSGSRSPLLYLCFRNHHHPIFVHTIKNHHPLSIKTGSVSPDTCRYPHDARTREQATRARHREHQEAQGARAERKTRRKTRTRQTRLEAVVGRAD